MCRLSVLPRGGPSWPAWWLCIPSPGDLCPCERSAPCALVLGLCPFSLPVGSGPAVGPLSCRSFASRVSRLLSVSPLWSLGSGPCCRFSLFPALFNWFMVPSAGGLIALPCRSCFPAVGRDPGRPAAGSPFLYGVIYAIYFRGDLPPGLPLPLGNRFGRSFAPGLIPLPVPSLPLGRIAS